MYIRHFETRTDGTVVRRKLTDTYNLQVDRGGKLTAPVTPVFEKTDDYISINSILGAIIGLNGYIPGCSQCRQRQPGHGSDRHSRRCGVGFRVPRGADLHLQRSEVFQEPGPGGLDHVCGLGSW